MAAYKGSVSRIEKVSNYVLFLVMLVLAGFLCALGNKVLGDFDHWFHAPSAETFQGNADYQAASLADAALQKQVDLLSDTKSTYERSKEITEEKYQREKQGYYDWLQARATLGSSQEDAVVRERAKVLDQYRNLEAGWQAQIDKVNLEQEQLEKKRTVFREKLQTLQAQSDERYSLAMRKYSLKIFFLRLALILPILGLGIYIFIRHRKNRYWPLSWGFILFSLYAFFIGLVPYLPSFGGYIRLAVGVALSLFVGFYVIKLLSVYVQKKRAELQESTLERASKIKSETAIRAFQSHSCPSCERDFFMNKWYPKTRQALEIRSVDEAPDHCAYCGLPLFGKCPHCGQRNFLHFPHCSSCGRDLDLVKSK